MPGSSWTACSAAMRAREISAPVASPPAWAIRSRWWPPSRVSGISPSGVAVELGAEATSSRTRAGPSVTSARTAATSQTPTPATRVSRRCSSGESAGSSAAAMPPWAHWVEPSDSTVLVTSRTAVDPLAQPQRGGQPGDAGADDDDVGRDGPARLGRGQPAGDGQRHHSLPVVAVVPAGTEKTSRAPPPGPDSHRHVVDQAGGADPAGDGQQGLPAVPLGHVLQGLRVDEDEVVDQHQRLPHQHGPGGPADGRGALDRGLGAGPQRPGQRQRRLAVGGGEVGVAAAERQPVRLAHGGHRDHLDGEVEVLDHPPDEQQLLGVLLAVVGAVGAG